MPSGNFHRYLQFEKGEGAGLEVSLLWMMWIQNFAPCESPLGEFFFEGQCIDSSVTNKWDGLGRSQSFSFVSVGTPDLIKKKKEKNSFSKSLALIPLCLSVMFVNFSTIYLSMV